MVIRLKSHGRFKIFHTFRVNHNLIGIKSSNDYVKILKWTLRSYFLKLEFSEENLQFWIECERYRQSAMRDRNDLSDTIIRKFIGVNAEMSVNLPSNLEEDALASQLSSEIPSFEAQQRHIYELMKFDSYPRFIKSEHYRKLVQMNITQKTVSQTTQHNGTRE